MKYVLLAFAFIGLMAWGRIAAADALDGSMQMRNATDNGWVNQLISMPSSGTSMVALSGASKLPMAIAATGLGIALLTAPDAATARTGLGIGAPAIVLTTTGTSGASTYNTSTGELNVPNYAIAARSFGTATLVVGTAAQVSATRDAQVSYPVDISVSSLLLGTAQGTICLRYADNVGMSTNLVTVGCGTNSTGGVLNVINIGTITLTGTIPAAKYRRIDFTTNSGTSSATPRQGQEVLL